MTKCLATTQPLLNEAMSKYGFFLEEDDHILTLKYKCDEDFSTVVARFNAVKVTFAELHATMRDYLVKTLGITL